MKTTTLEMECALMACLNIRVNVIVPNVLVVSSKDDKRRSIMRNMSFFLTTEQIRNKTKHITRRFGWWNLKTGTVLNACVKCQGLKKGEKIEGICQIRIKSTRREFLYEVTKDECIKEGFPNFEAEDFINMITKHYKCNSYEIINRIEFEYV